MSGKGGSNSRPSAWEADALPLSYSRVTVWVWVWLKCECSVSIYVVKLIKIQ